MRKLVVLCTLVLLAVVGCKPVHVAPYSDTKFVAHPTQGLLVIETRGDEVQGTSGKDAEKHAIDNAFKKGLEHVFFMGFPGTDFKNPMFREDRTAFEQRNARFLTSFWNGGYERFITNPKTIQVKPCLDKRRNCNVATVQFEVNYNMLRKEFENKGAVNKIGF